MKTVKMILPAVVLAVAMLAPSCKKNQCYECSKNVGQPNEGHWNMCNEEDHDNAVAAGYTCTEVQ
jgi:outer membrane murein-binding lipoprotein Lpp